MFAYSRTPYLLQGMTPRWRIYAENSNSSCTIRAEGKVHAVRTIWPRSAEILLALAVYRQARRTWKSAGQPRRHQTALPITRRSVLVAACPSFILALRCSLLRIVDAYPREAPLVTMTLPQCRGHLTMLLPRTFCTSLWAIPHGCFCRNEARSGG